MTILILAYASEPGAGSEYGVGWMVPLTMAQRHPEHQIYVLTRGRCREKIETTLSTLNLPNLHYLFYDIPRWMFRKNEMQSHWGEQINYWLWQVMLRHKVKGSRLRVEGAKDVQFDIVHHLTFNQYRTPSVGYWMDIPFIVGPIGGAECIASAFLQDLDEHTAKKERMRLKGRDLPIFRWLNTRRKNKKVILCSSQENVDRLTPYKGNSEICLMPAIGYSNADFNANVNDVSHSSSLFTLIYAGKAFDWKGIHIFLKASARAFSMKEKSAESAKSAHFKIKLIGIRSENEQQMVMGWVKEEGLTDNVELIPFIQRAELLKMMTTANLSVYPAFRDSGSMSVLEASALGCPTICFDAGGQDAFPDDILLKVKVGKTYDECLDAFAYKLRWAYDHRDEAAAIGKKSQEWVEQNLTWEKKVNDFVYIYNNVTD